MKPPSSSSSSSSSSWVLLNPPKPTPLSDFNGDLSLEVMSSSSSFTYLSDEPLSLSSLSLSDLELDTLKSETDENESIHEKEEIDHLKNSSSGKLLTGGVSFPPPISCLKLFKKGTPCTFLCFDEEEGGLVFEEIMIPKRDIFHASRTDGRLKLFSHHSDQDNDQKDEEEEN